MGARRAPELINLLNLEQQFPHNVLKRFLTSFGASDAAVGMPKTAEIDCQVRLDRGLLSFGETGVVRVAC